MKKQTNAAWKRFVTKERAWKSRTCPECKQRFVTKERMLTHYNAEHQLAAPTNQNQLSTMQYSQEQHIRDLETELGRNQQVRERLIQAAVEGFEVIPYVIGFLLRGVK